MQIKSVLPRQIMPGDKILHKIEGIVQVTFTQPDGTGDLQVRPVRSGVEGR